VNTAQVRGEDFSSYLAKLSTPRELLIMMTEMFARIEAHPEGGLTAQVRQREMVGWLVVAVVGAVAAAVESAREGPWRRRRLTALCCGVLCCCVQDMEIAVTKALEQSV
jgi:hypothetical protein